MGNDRLTTFLAGALFGAAVAFMIDPDRGKRRRAFVRDQLVSGAHSLDDTVTGVSIDARNRTRGMLHEARTRMTEDDADDRVIEQRVRAELGRLTTHPRAIAVWANDGCVTLSGRILAPEVDAVIGGVRSVRGVSDVRNQLEIHEQAGNMPDLQTHERHA